MAKKILTVDDSALMRRVLSDILQKDPRFELEASANNGLEAYDLLVQHPGRFDLVILDINMPKMNGIALMEKLNSKGIRTPVLIVSSLAKEGAAETIRCLELGAFDFITKPDSFLETKSEAFARKIIEVMCAALKLEILKETSRSGLVEVSRQAEESKALSAMEGTVMDGPMSYLSIRKYNRLPHRRVDIKAKRLVVICSSTGGPKALQQVIPKIPGNLNAPVLLIQHMPESFTGTLATRLNDMSGLMVKEAESGDILERGHLYLAKGGKHMRIVERGGMSMIELNDDPARSGLKPCADVTFESLVSSRYDEITCVVLTGMGSDGTRGIGKLTEKQNCFVVAQDEASCTVYGMPRMVKEAGLTDAVLPLEQIAEVIVNMVGRTF